MKREPALKSLPHKTNNVVRKSDLSSALWQRRTFTGNNSKIGCWSFLALQSLAYEQPCSCYTSLQQPMDTPIIGWCICWARLMWQYPFLICTSALQSVTQVTIKFWIQPCRLCLWFSDWPIPHDQGAQTSRLVKSRVTYTIWPEHRWMWWDVIRHA